MNKIVPHLWFDHHAEEAVKHYSSIFKNFKTGAVTHYSEEVSKVAKMPVGSVLTIEFSIDGQDFMALNGGPMFKFNEAISFMVNCETQAEIDDLYSKLSADPKAEQCGWLKDKFGVSWQIVPAILQRMMTDKDKTKVNRVMAAFMPMKKLDIATLKRAFEGK